MVICKTFLFSCTTSGINPFTWVVVVVLQNVPVPRWVSAAQTTTNTVSLWLSERLGGKRLHHNKSP